MQKGKRWQPVELELLSDLYWKGYTNDEIADEFGCSVSRIKDALNYHRISMRTMASMRRMNTIQKRKMPKRLRLPTPLPKMECPTEAPKSKELSFMDALENQTCVWLDGKLKACGHKRKQGHRYCQAHYERSLKKYEVRNG